MAPYVKICRATSGSRPWYCVPLLSEAHPLEACWLATGQRDVAGRSTDGQVRYFRRRRDLVAALPRGVVVCGKTLVES